MAQIERVSCSVKSDIVLDAILVILPGAYQTCLMEELNGVKERFCGQIMISYLSGNLRAKLSTCRIKEDSEYTRQR